MGDIIIRVEVCAIDLAMLDCDVPLSTLIGVLTDSLENIDCESL